MSATGIPDWLVDHLVEREQARHDAAAEVFGALTERERLLVKEAAVMGYVQGMRHADVPIPKDSVITARVVEACLAFADQYPTISGAADLLRRTASPTEDTP